MRPSNTWTRRHVPSEGRALRKFQPDVSEARLFQRSRRGRFSWWWLDFPKAGKGSGNAPPNRRLAQGAAGPQGRTHQTGGCRAWVGEAPRPCPALGRKRRAGRSRAELGGRRQLCWEARVSWAGAAWRRPHSVVPREPAGPRAVPEVEE